MTDASELLAAAIEPAAGKAPGGWTPPSVEILNGVLPQLEVLALIGQGGMGAVYKARQTHLERVVAVKLLSAERGVDPAFVERFTREARALARLQHPQIVTLYDFGRAGSWLYLVMEYVDGANLRQVMATGRLDPAAALRLVAPICDALAHAHAQGVVHRDLKPENILIDAQGQPKIADFGLAKLRSVDGTLTQTGDALGTLHYMSPEQVSGVGEIDHRADVYALGVIFYELLTGSLPLGRCAPPSQSGSDPRLDEVVLRSLEREPDKRWQTVEELRKAVAKIQMGMVPASTPGAATQPRWSFAAMIGLAIAVIGAMAWMLTRPNTVATPPVTRPDPVATPLTVSNPPSQEKPAASDARIAETRLAEERQDQAVREAKRIETHLAGLELRRVELERKIAALHDQSGQAEAEAARVAGTTASAKQQQEQLVSDIERLTMQRQHLTQELDEAMKAIQAHQTEVARRQEFADALAAELTMRLPGPALAVPTRLEMRYDHDAMSTIGIVVHADGTRAELAPVSWPRDGAKVLVSASRDLVARQFTDVVIAHYQKHAERQRLIGELVVRADELERLDVSGQHAALVADLKRLGNEMP